VSTASPAQAAARAQGEDTPSEDESSGGDDEEDGEVTPPPNLHRLRTILCLVTSSANKGGSPSVHIGRNGLRRRLGCRLPTTTALPCTGIS
jgi:hypothetical protein